MRGQARTRPDSLPTKGKYLVSLLSLLFLLHVDFGRHLQLDTRLLLWLRQVPHKGPSCCRTLSKTFLKVGNVPVGVNGTAPSGTSWTNITFVCIRNATVQSTSQSQRKNERGNLQRPFPNIRSRPFKFIGIQVLIGKNIYCNNLSNINF